MAKKPEYEAFTTGELLKGRSLTIRDAYNELSADGKAEVDALCTWLVEWMKEKCPTVHLSKDDALELIWQLLIFQDDPHGKREIFRQDVYEQRINHEKLLATLAHMDEAEVAA